MTLTADDTVCQSFSSSSSGIKAQTSHSSYAGESDGSINEKRKLGFADEKDESGIPVITPVYNGRVLDIAEALIVDSLSGLSLKHYDGNCVQPTRHFDYGRDEYFHGEDYYFDFGEAVIGEKTEEAEEQAIEAKTEERSSTIGNVSNTSSMIRLCYEPKKRSESSVGQIVQEDISDFRDKPLCIQDGINYRNSFWNLHRPELCKLTWPHDYVTEAIVVEHLHRHLLNHGPVCAAFHEHRDMIAMLDKELDFYGKLRELLPPRDIPPDENPFESSGKKQRLGPCQARQFEPAPGEDWTDESDLNPYQSVHPSKEEFCITIGKPVRVPDVRETVPEVEVPEQEQLWSGEVYGEGEYDICQDYSYSDWDESPYPEYQAEEEEGSYVQEEETESEATEPQGWVEPDYCAMI